MGKDHIKRLAAPKTWQTKRKGLSFITKLVPGPHSSDTGMPLSVLLKEVLNYANTTREVKKILNTSGIKIDGKSRKDSRFPVGIFDTIEFTNVDEHFRIVLNRKGRIDLVKIKKEESLLKPCKIIGKTMVRGKLQLNLFDGKNIIVDKNLYSVGDTLILSLPEQKISKHLKLGKKSTIFLTGGKHIGEIGSVEDIVESRVIYKNDKGDLIETSKKYAFVVGDNKPLITLNKHEPDEKHQS
ncbi:30S ribosomal protein S4e [Candidatus Woesearchaeota archaeon]|nr:30S ribosomal protein S4e [Candidatus Woesearchaeota archaeon]